MKFRYFIILLAIAATTLVVSCSTTRYVPTGKYLLQQNEVDFRNVKEIQRSEKLDKNAIAQYIKQRPNRRLLGLGIYLGVYSICDTSKHNWWHRLWSEKVGEPPVIYDSTLTTASVREMEIYLGAKGYLNAEVSDSMTVKNRKATVYYKVDQQRPYTISSLGYKILDPFVHELMMEDTASSLLKPGRVFDRQLLEAERTRISNRLMNLGFFGFNANYINYTADSTIGNNQVSLILNVRKRTIGYTEDGDPILGNHPLYRIGRIVVNSDYDPTKSIEQNQQIIYDTMVYNGIEILYENKMYIRPEVLVNAIRLSPNELYDMKGVQRTYANVNRLGYSTTILFNPLPADTTAPVYVSIAAPDGTNISTREEQLECLIQCTPNVRQSFTTDFEASTTADYYSMALSLGYQNRNLLRGAEVFNVAFRGAYEFVKAQGKQNSFEFGINTSLEFPRLLIPIRDDKLAKFSQSNTKISLSANLQRRPDYTRVLFSGTFGYSWSLRNGARFTVNPIDINVVNVPWVDSTFLKNISNPYLRNSYNSQLIAGLSASYYYNTNTNPKMNNLTIRANMDVNGNLFNLIGMAVGSKTTYHTSGVSESYYKLFGLRFAQYARASFEISNRVNISDKSQIAWRFFVGGGVPYGNSSSIPFERLFFAGGSNSMRGWQVRSLGPGAVAPDTVSSYANQLGNIRLEANFEYRVNVIGGFNMALFFDAGNIWMNSKGEARKEARFSFNNFYKQIALNTGIGVRYDFNMFIIRLDWGWKMYNPGLPPQERWFSQFRFKNTALHFAIGLPF